MADLSNLFGSPPAPRALRPTGFEGGAKAQEFKRAIVMREALEQDLAPDDGLDFFKFVGRRLFELGDAQGAFAVGQQAQQLLAGQSAGAQQGFENQIRAGEFAIKQSQGQRAANAVAPPKSRTVRRGTKQVTQEFNPGTGQFEDIATGEAFAPPNSININTGSGESEIAEEINAIQKDVAAGKLDPAVGQQAIAAAINKVGSTKQSETVAAQLGNIQALDAQLEPALAAYETAAENLRNAGNKPSLELIKKFDAARGTLVLATAGRNNTKGEPSGPVLDAAEAMIPGKVGVIGASKLGQDTAGAVVQQIRKQFGLTTAAPAVPPEVQKILESLPPGSKILSIE